uniref:Probable molybdenum cofactor guanylyltransferase n=1 Tax=uncultured marine bacterium 560 TaxID=257395 RepID=Q6SGI7_9BACT|nr:molybdopterin-guanine dinucleotide biosynthesis protein A [uncultured marine bacterium 560]
MNKITKNEITAVILAGGQALRMNGEDKGLIVFRELPLITHVVNVTKPKVSQILISANRNFEEYANFGKVISDDLEGYQGPLAGISKALKVCSTPYLLVLPCDSPLIDEALIDSLIEKMEISKVDICVAHDGSIMHATFALIQTKLEKSLEEFLEEGGRKMALWYRQHSLERIDVSSHLEVLTNINRPEDFNL